MWRPVALSAFLALLFMSSRSGQQPIETGTNDTKKADLGSESSEAIARLEHFKIDLSRSSLHVKDVKDQTSEKQQAEESSESPKASSDAEQAEADQAPESLRVGAKKTIPLPAPKTRPGAKVTRVVVTQGEQKTALTSGDEALRLLPPGPDFAAKVQRELSRLGCYHGRVDNIWGPLSRNAVAQFNRVAKSKLPLKQPTRALLSSARKAPDGYCSGDQYVRGEQAKVASLDPDNGLEAIRKRPEYLPPWMRGEPMPNPSENSVEVADEPDVSAEKPKTRSAARVEPRARKKTRRARRTSQRRRAYRKRQSFSSVMDGRGAFWPGQ